MAQRLNKPMYGTQELQQAPTTVSYTFNVGGDAQIANMPQLAPRPVVQTESGPLPSQELPIEFELIPMDTLSPEGVALPDVGPFFAPAQPKHKTLAEKDTLFALWAQTED
jgi:hypothetical protein